MKIQLQILTFMTVLFGFSIFAHADDFFDAYQKEYAFLEAERKALNARLDEIEKEAASKEAAAQREIQSLQAQLLSIHNRADAVEMDLDETERDNSDMAERQDMFMETMSRARETIEQYGYEISAPSDNIEVQATQTVNLFHLVDIAYDKGASVEIQEGDFFLTNGKKVEGKILTIGNVAAYGVSGDGGGALAPAGGGRFKVWDNSTQAIAASMIEGVFPKTLPIFLYESMEKPVEHKDEKTWKEIIDSGGIIAWIIVWLGGITVLMILARLIILVVAGTRTEKLIGTVSSLARSGKMTEALAKCKKAKGAAAHVLKVTLENLHREREKLDDIISEAILNKAPLVDRFNTSILVAASVAPLLGLLGTVTGMISTFDIITEHGTGDPKMLSGGISEALVTTELGLIVAIPSLLFGTLLSGRASAIMDAMERAALQVINIDDIKNKARDNTTELDSGDGDNSKPSEDERNTKTDSQSDIAAEAPVSTTPAEATV
ncbi:MAG: MotA/TolQ/ExbB proton channel family protein [Deltaproteobacteria bacterium]|nr:MotA/TolQ/ExbB proton channel family protein [Deltaproteobacteria bacterium]